MFRYFKNLGRKRSGTSRKAKSSRRRRNRTFECLENRQLMAADIVGGVLTVTGDELGVPTNDKIEISADNGWAVVKITNKDTGLPTSPAQQFLLSSFSSVSVDGRSGNDEIRYNLTKNSSLYGGDGNDQIFGGNGVDQIFGGNGADTLEGGGGNDVLFGGNGDDTIKGRSGNDILMGGSGNDTMHGGEDVDNLHGEAGNDTLDGGSDFDWFHFGGTANLGHDVIEEDGSNNGLTFGALGHSIELDLASNDRQDVAANLDLTLKHPSSLTNVNGTAFGDYIYGNNHANWIEGQGGNDHIEGGGGNDHLWGDEGYNALVGVRGTDYLDGGSGNDELHGGIDGHEDVMRGGTGRDKFFAEWYLSSLGRRSVWLNRERILDFSSSQGDTVV